jgi:hypothetical protein
LFQLAVNSNIPDGLCVECHQFLEKSIDFSKNCARADAMFKEIVENFPVLPEDEEALKIREKHRFDIAGSLDCKPSQLTIESLTFKMEIEDESDDPLPEKRKRKSRSKHSSLSGKSKKQTIRGTKVKTRKETKMTADPIEDVEVKLEEEPIEDEEGM